MKPFELMGVWFIPSGRYDWNILHLAQLVAFPATRGCLTPPHAERVSPPGDLQPPSLTDSGPLHFHHCQWEDVLQFTPLELQRLPHAYHHLSSIKSTQKTDKQFQLSALEFQAVIYLSFLHMQMIKLNKNVSSRNKTSWPENSHFRNNM